MKRGFTTVLLLIWTLCAVAVQKSGVVVSINGAKYYVHTVEPGQTLYALSKEYGVGEQVIVGHNPSAAAGLKAGEQIKIPFLAKPQEQLSDKKLRKTFSTHNVTKGETLYAIARRYQVPIQTIVEDNPRLDPVHLRLGEQILIRKKQIGSETEAENKAQWEDYRTSLNSVVADAGYSYHIVHPGETFYSLARRFAISEEELSALNGGLKPAELKAGAMLKVPGAADQHAVPVDSVAQTSVEEVTATGREIRIDPLRRGETLNVALLLPMTVGNETNTNFLEFYQGFLLGLDSVKRMGISVDVGLFNTGRNAATIDEIVRSDAFRRANLVVGPVYEEGLAPVVRYAEEHQIPVVSPLANITQASSDVLFQLAPDPALKYAKVADLLGGSKQVTLIYSGTTDKEFEQEILAELKDTKYSKHTYKYTHPSAGGSSGDLSSLLDNGEDNVFVIMADNEVAVDRIMAAIASADTNLTARGRTAPRFVVLGNARWNRYNTLDREMFFKNRVVFVSTYHAKRDSQVVAAFDKAYIRAFGSLPTLYSYRGYDAAILFAPAMYDRIGEKLAGERLMPLETTYLFGPGQDRLNHVNRNWMRVNYHPNFTITTE